MKNYTLEELAALLTAHRKWYFGQEGGEKADFQGAILLRLTALQQAKLQDLKIKHFVILKGLYKYLVIPVIAEDGCESIERKSHATPELL